jgi:hypothetical protein
VKSSRLAALIGSLVGGVALLVPITAAFAQSVSSSGTAGVTLTGGCSGTANALDKAGATISSATAPGRTGASPSHPFVVNRDGTVPWQGQTAGVITNHSWHVDVYGIQVKSGGSANTGQKTTASGVEKVKDYLKIPFVGLFKVSGGISGTGGSCSGDVWVKFAGSPIGTLGWILGVVFFVGGLAVAFFALPSGSKGAVV